MGFLLERHCALPVYTPGDHEEGGDFIRLNTNESPYPPSPSVAAAVAREIGALQFYNDPDCTLLHREMARVLGVKPENVMATNGSDEALYLAFLAFADASHPIALPDITYGYYDLFASVLGIPLHRVPLDEDFRVHASDYMGRGEMIVLANPNAPTGYALSLAEIEAICRTNPQNVVLIDEAYVDFGAESAVSLIDTCPNLLVVQTFSKSRSMAGARIGFAIGCEELITELGTIHNAVGLYSVSRMAQAAGVAALRENEYYVENCRLIEQDRAFAADGLRALGFTVLESKANFLFAESSKVSSRELQAKLREEYHILIRRWNGGRIDNFSRITIGTHEQMKKLLNAIATILKEKKVHA